MVGLKAILRTPVKTALFFLLIAVVTVFLSLGVGMLSSADRMLDEADEVFLTAGEFVFVQGHYPDATEYDEALAKAAAAFDFDAIAAKPQVLSAERNLLQRAYLEGYEPALGDMPYEKYAVLQVTVRNPDTMYGGHVSLITGMPYASGKVYETSVYLYPQEGADAVPETGRQYIVFGAFFTIPGQSYAGFQILPFSSIDTRSTDKIPPLLDITGAEDMEAVWASAEGQAFARMAEMLRIWNNSIDLQASMDVDAISAFHRGEYTVTQGRALTEEDYRTGGVCLLPKRVASQLEIAIGDTVTLSVQHPAGATGLYESYSSEGGFAAVEDFEVVGIYQAAANDIPIVIPDAGQPWLGHGDNDYTLARVVVDNRTAASFIRDVEKSLPDGIQLAVFDDGYAEAVRPIEGMRETALVITVICAIACVLILFFFGFFFVFRNRETARILWSLGTSASGIVRYFLVGSGAITLVAAAVGSAVGYFVSRGVIVSLYESIVATTRHDLRFSLSAYGVAPDSFAPTPQVLSGPYWIIGLVVVVLAILSCMVFTALVIRAQSPFVQAKRGYRQAQRQKRRQNRAKQERAPRQALGAKLSDRLAGVSLRYAVKSMLRGGKRSGAVPLLFAVLLTFLCVFSGVRADYQRQLDNVYRDVPVTMQLSDISGRLIDNLVVRYEQLVTAWESNFIAETAVSQNTRYLYMGVTEYADGTVPEVLPELYELPRSAFVLETFMNQLDFLTMPMIISSNVPNAPAFFYDGAPAFTFAADESWETFYSDENALILPRSTLEKEGLALGDTVSIVLIFKNRDTLFPYQIDVKIAGTYDAGADREEAYMPLILGEGLEIATPQQGEEITDADIRAFRYQVFNSAAFVLKDTDRLTELKDWLQTRYDALGVPGKYRQWVIVNDTALYSTIDTLNRHISYVNLVYPLAFVLVAGIGFLVSSLLLKSRAREIGVLQSVGTSRGGIFLSLFIEQVLLSIPGILCGVLLALLLQGGQVPMYLGVAGIFAACYFAGTALAIIHTYRNTALKALAQKEE